MRILWCNNGNASCEDVLAVLHEVQRRVKEKFGVHIPLDVRMLGEGLEQETINKDK